MAAKTVPNYVLQIPGAPSLTESQKTWYLELGIDCINTFKKKAKHNNNNNINKVLPESTNSGFLKINWKKDTYCGSIQSLSSFSKYFPFAGSSSHT